MKSKTLQGFQARCARCGLVELITDDNQLQTILKLCARRPCGIREKINR